MSDQRLDGTAYIYITFHTSLWVHVNASVGDRDGHQVGNHCPNQLVHDAYLEGQERVLAPDDGKSKRNPR